MRTPRISVLVILILIAILSSCVPKTSEFADLRVAFMIGGNKDHEFARRVYKGARAAEARMGCQVDYYWSDWDTERMTLDLLKAIDSNPDAICVMGHPGPVIMRPLVDEAIRKGIVVTSQNVYLPELEGEYQHEGFGYVGQDVYEAGRKLVRAALGRFPLGEETQVAVIGIAAMGSRGKRTSGILDELTDRDIAYTYLDVTDSVTDDTGFEASLRDFLAQESRVDYLFFDHITPGTIDILKNTGVDPDNLYTFCFDLTGTTIRGLDSGFIDLIQDQEPFLQGFMPVVQACLSVKYGFAGMHILTDASYIDKTNLAAVRDLVDQEYR